MRGAGHDDADLTCLEVTIFVKYYIYTSLSEPKTNPCAVLRLNLSLPPTMFKSRIHVNTQPHPRYRRVTFGQSLRTHPRACRPPSHVFPKFRLTHSSPFQDQRALFFPQSERQRGPEFLGLRLCSGLAAPFQGCCWLRSCKRHKDVCVCVECDLRPIAPRDVGMTGALLVDIYNGSLGM